jgi:formylglycine-generating enzyme required for sulfatase activity
MVLATKQLELYLWSALITAAGFLSSASAQVASTTDAFAQQVDALRLHPDDLALRQRIVKAAQAQTPPPAIPEEARRHFIRGNTALEDARDAKGFKRAIDQFEQALQLAPWWGDIYLKLGKAHESIQDYPGAIDALQLYVLSGPGAAEARQAQDHVYVLEEKRDELLTRPQESNQTAAAVLLASPAPPVVEVPQEAIKRQGAIFRDCADCPEMVTINATVAMGKTLITQKQWRDLMGNNPSFFQHCGDDCPVENVSWNDVQELIGKLNDKTGRTYALPTEAQWEAACHAGPSTEYCDGPNLNEFAWHLKNSGAQTHPVGTKKPNVLGLYDLAGNVWEWTTDCSNPDCRYRVLRGGSWSFDPQYPGSRKRIAIDPSHRLSDYGVRLVRALR